MKLTKQNYLNILEEYDKIRKEYAESKKVLPALSAIDFMRNAGNDNKANELEKGYLYRKNEYNHLESAKLENDAEVKRFIIDLEEENKTIDEKITQVKEEILRLKKVIEQYKNTGKENEKIVRDLREWLSNDYFTKDNHSEKRNIEIGDTIQFGRYPQNTDGNDKTPIEWIVLDKEVGKALITSKYAIDCKRYNTSRTKVTWETCSLRTWLNSTFLNNAFTAEEQSQIQYTRVSADKNPEFNNYTDPGIATTDEVFLLSINEAEKYFTTFESRICVPTAYAKAHGADTCNDYKTASGEAPCIWWLRSPGDSQTRAALVGPGGGVYCTGEYVRSADVAVRPALWINLES